MGSVAHIFVAPARGAPMEPRRFVVAQTDGGLDGDRYADANNRRGPEYQVTLIESENIAAFSELVEAPFTPDMPRRNIVTQGVVAPLLRASSCVNRVHYLQSERTVKF